MNTEKNKMKGLYTKADFLDLVGEDADPSKEWNPNSAMAYNQAKAEIRKRINEQK